MSFLRAIRLAVTWRLIVITQALSLLSVEANKFDHESLVPTLSELAVCVCTAFVTASVMLGANEALRRGTRLWRAYSIAVLTIILLSWIINAITQWYVGSPINSSSNHASPWTWFLVNGLNNSLWGSFATLAYLNRCIAQRMIEAVRSAAQRRARLDRHLVDARLAAAEAELDPQMLLSSLAEVRTGLLQPAPGAEDKLEALTQTLRAALARIRRADDTEAVTL